MSEIEKEIIEKLKGKHIQGLVLLNEYFKTKYDSHLVDEYEDFLIRVSKIDPAFWGDAYPKLINKLSKNYLHEEILEMEKNLTEKICNLSELFDGSILNFLGTIVFPDLKIKYKAHIFITSLNVLMIIRKILSTLDVTPITRGIIVRTAQKSQINKFLERRKTFSANVSYYNSRIQELKKINSGIFTSIPITLPYKIRVSKKNLSFVQDYSFPVKIKFVPEKLRKEKDKFFYQRRTKILSDIQELLKQIAVKNR